MGKPLLLQRGKRYLIARCPKCAEIVDAIKDPGSERSMEGEATWAISCTDCGPNEIDLNTVEPETWFGDKGASPRRS